MVELEISPHQEKAVDDLSNGKILCGLPGTGKSRVAMVYYWQQEAPKDVYVITTAKKRDSLDWEDEAILLGIGKVKGATLEGVLTVDSWNNIAKYEDVEDAFFIFDEQRLVGSGAWVGSFYKIAKRNNWIMLSATPGDTWLDYIPVFVANGFYKNRSEFKRDHVVYTTWSKFPKVDRYVGVGKLVRLRNSLLVEMPYQRHTTRIINNYLVGHDNDELQKAVKTRWDPYLNEPMRDVAGFYRVMRRIVNSDQSRTEAVLTLLKEHPRLIVFYNFDYELEMLRTCLQEEQEHQWILNSKDGLAVFLPVEERSSTGKNTSLSGSKNGIKVHSNLNENTKGVSNMTAITPSVTDNLSTVGINGTTNESNSIDTFEIAEWNGHKHQPIPESDSWVYLVQYRAGAEGWNCIETDATVFYSLTYSYRDFFQAQGRIDRMNTKFSMLYYYILRSKAQIDAEIWKALKAKKDFNEMDVFKNLGKSWQNS